MTDIRRTILWVIFGFSMVLLWDKWQIHNGNPPMFFPSTTPIATAPSPDARKQEGASSVPTVQSTPTASGAAITAGGDAPNPNYFDPRYLLSMYGNAWGDLFKGAFVWTKEGKDYREGAVSLIYRAAGLLLPGIASHSPRDYVNAVRLGSIAPAAAKEV